MEKKSFITAIALLTFSFFIFSACGEKIQGTPEIPALKSVEVTTSPEKTVYTEGESFNPAGMVVTAYYDNGTSNPVTDYTITPEILSLGTTYVTITYGGRYTKLNITVNSMTPIIPGLISIVVTTPPGKTVYAEGQTFLTDGMVVTATFDDGNVEQVTGYIYSPMTPLTISDKAITISYGGKSTTVNITVNSATGLPVLMNIEVTTPPAKTVYIEGQIFLTDGMVVTANFNDGSSEPVTNYIYAPMVELTTEDTFITIAYSGKYTTTDITVNPKGSFSTDYFSKDFDPDLTSFYDKFEGGTGTGFTSGGVDLSKWGFQNGNGTEYGIAGWGNGERQSYRTDNVTVQDGYLRINAKYVNPQVNSRSYTSGKLVTANSHGDAGLGEPAGGTGVKFGQTWGRFEAKIRMNAGRGAWPAFWMMPVSGSYGGWPRSGEIDIMEMVGITPREASSTMHVMNTWGGGESWYRGSTHTFENNTTFEDWHIYGVLWTKTQIKILLDGKVARTIDSSWWCNNWYNSYPKNEDIGYPPFNKDFHFIINLALDSGQFSNANSIDNNQTGLNFTLDVEWVRAYTLENDPWPAPEAYPSTLWRSHGN